MARPNVSSFTNTSMPIRTPYSPHSHLDRPSSPLAPTYDKRDTYITPGTSRREHKKVYSVDDSSHSTKLVAERDTLESARHRDTADRGYSSLTSGGRSYHSTTKAPPRLTELGDDGYSYTDPASMYRDTEPAWRRPRAGSLERSSRPTSMIADRPPRSSARELGPPPSTRGFDKINHNIPRAHGRSGSIERSREIPKYEPYPDAAPVLPARASSTRQRAPAIHQEPREHRRDTYHDDYDRRDRDGENRRHTADRFEDREVTSRGFGIAPGVAPIASSHAHDHHPLDRQPIWPAAAPEPARSRPQEASNQYYQPERAEARMPDARIPDPRSSRDRDLAPPQDSYEKRSRDREGSNGGFVPAAAGAAAGVAATLGAANYMKSRDKDRDADRDRDSSGERERERRREYDERDRRDRHDDRRDDRRERRVDDRRDSQLPPPPPPAAAPAAIPPPVAAAYPPPPVAESRPRERRYEDDDRERSSRKAPSSEGSGDERPRHYVDRDAERKREAAPKEAALDPDEEYRRRIQQEAERSSRPTRDRDSDSDRERDRRRRKDDRSRSRDAKDRRVSPPSARDAPSSRYDERSSSVYDASMVQEPESLDRAQDSSNRSVQIVTPPKESAPQVKGILRKPTSKFPEDPEPIREGVAPHKDALKGKDIPVGARWTRIDRRLVNPEALEQAKERFEERMDCVIVLRVLTKEDIQKLADRTKKIRETRGMFAH